MFVTLWSPAGIAGACDGAVPRDDGARDGRRPAPPPTAPPSALTALLADVLAGTPHAVAEPWGGGTLVWADGRGLPARTLARTVRQAAVARGLAAARVGLARVPVAAAVAARWGAARGDADPAGDARPGTAVASGSEAAFLAPHPLGVLLADADPPAVARTAAALGDAGVPTCGALAALTAAAVEVRFGAAGVALWHRARADDRRAVFRHAARDLPSASVAWTGYELREPTPLLFAIAGLVDQVCTALTARGEAAHTLTLTCALAGGGAVVRPVRGARETAHPAVWRRLVRAALERLGQADGGLPDGVVGVALTVTAAAAARAPQADLFDRGAASAGEAERAVARLVEDEAGRLVAPRASAHPVPEQRLTADAAPVATALRALERPPRAGSAPGAAPRAPAAAPPVAPPLALVPHEPSAAAPPTASPVDAPAADGPAAARALRLHLYPTPRALAMTTKTARGHRVPVHYRERLPEGARAPRGGQPLVAVLVAGGPDVIAADYADDGAPVARDYWHCLTDQGALVLVYRDRAGAAAADAADPAAVDGVDADGRWFLHGWWG